MKAKFSRAAEVLWPGNQKSSLLVRHHQDFNKSCHTNCKQYRSICKKKKKKKKSKFYIYFFFIFSYFLPLLYLLYSFISTLLCCCFNSDRSTVRTSSTTPFFFFFFFSGSGIYSSDFILVLLISCTSRCRKANRLIDRYTNCSQQKYLTYSKNENFHQLLFLFKDDHQEWETLI